MTKEPICFYNEQTIKIDGGVFRSLSEEEISRTCNVL